MKYVVYHSEYGCDTGCCGHFVEISEDDGTYVGSDFDFSHPYDLYRETDENRREMIKREFARKLLVDNFGEDHVADLDWENCLISDD